MNQLVAIALGGALGAVMRYLASRTIHYYMGAGFPYGTLTVNVIGSLLIGFISILLLEKFAVGDFWRAILIIGFLGAFTTFSTFSFETLSLVQNGEIGKALLNIALNVSVCLIATWSGIILGRQL